MSAMNDHDRVYAHILGLHGSHGSMDQILKHRTQIDLKDKAINKKCELMRSGRKVPWYLESRECLPM